MFAEKEGNVAMGMILHCGEDKTLKPGSIDWTVPPGPWGGFLRVDELVGDHD